MNEQAKTWQELLTEHHGTVERFLRCRGLDPGEYYDVVIFGAIRCARNYCEQPALRKYPLDALLCKTMRWELYSYWRNEHRRRAIAGMVSLEALRERGWDCPAPSGENPAIRCPRPDRPENGKIIFIKQRNAA